MLGYLSLELQEQLNTLMLPVLVLIGLAVAVAVDPYVRKPVKHIMLMIDAAVMMILFACCVSNALNAAWNPAYVTAETALSVYCYIMRPAIIVLFIYVIWDDPRRRLFWIPIVINTLIYMTAFYRPWTFWIDTDGMFHRGPLGYAAHWIGLIMLFSQLTIALAQIRKADDRDRLSVSTNRLLWRSSAFRS